MSGVHARLAASSAHRWLVCAPSVDLSKGKNTTSEHAARGTFAHDIAAKCLQDASISPSDFLLQKKTVDGFAVECDLEMVDSVRLYIDEILADWQEGDQWDVEVDLFGPLQKIDKDCGGTADYIRYRPSTQHLRVWDFKYGAGVYVEVFDNKQLKQYALGALLGLQAPVTDVTMTIVQPRYEGALLVRDFHFKAVELLDFIADVKEAAERTRKPGQPLVAGDHCKFCPAARECPELERRHHALVAAEFADLSTITPTKLAAALVSIPQVKERIKAIEEYAYVQATKGVEIPGFKLVEKRANRAWKSPEAVIQWAEEAEINPFAEPELLSPAQIEKLLAANAPRGKKKDAGAVLEPLVERKSSGTALVPVVDERPAAKQITAEDFAVVEGTASKKEASPLSSMF